MRLRLEFVIDSFRSLKSRTPRKSVEESAPIMTARRSGSASPGGGNECDAAMTEWDICEEVRFRGDTSESHVGVDDRARTTTVVDCKICNNSSHRECAIPVYCGIRSTLGTPTGQLLHHAISSAFRIHFFDATLICHVFVDVSVVYLASRRVVSSAENCYFSRGLFGACARERSRWVH